MRKIKLLGKSKKGSDRSIGASVRSTKYMLRFIWHQKHGKSYIILKLLMSVLNALLPIALIYVPGLLINELMGGMRTNVLLVYIGVIIGIPLFQAAVMSPLRILMGNRYNDFYDEMSTQTVIHSADMDYETIEKPDMDVVRERVAGSIHECLSIVDYLGGLISAAISIVTCASVLSVLNPFLIILVIIAVIFNFVKNKAANKRNYELNNESAKYNRYCSPVFSYFLYNKYAKEMKVFNLKDFFLDLYKDKRNIVYKLNVKYSKFTVRDNIIDALISFAQNAVLYVYFIYQVFNGSVAVGSLTIYIGMVMRFTNSIFDITGQYLQLSGRSVRVRDFMEFMDIPLNNFRTGDLTPSIDGNSVIEFKNVSFKYPGSDIYALKNFNIKIKCGEKLCIVGENGSGKSTFVKLLTRLYVPCEGEILLNGININKYEYSGYLRLFAPVFQDFALFNLTLRENIMMADEFDKDKMISAAEQSGAAKLSEKNKEKGYDTVIYKWFDADGIEPSGGEGQRIAIARALYHGGEIYILDEPTAALDPNAEYEIYTQFHNMIKGKTAVIITHRLSAVQLADKVAVFEGGHVAEYGTHAELYAKGGIYAEMFDKQAQFYRDAAEKPACAEEQ